MKRLGATLFLTVYLLASLLVPGRTQGVQSFNYEQERLSLKGLSGIQLTVVVDPKYVAYGVDRQSVISSVESSLRKSGIPIVTDRPVQKSQRGDYGELVITLSVMSYNDTTCISSVAVQVEQIVRTQHDYEGAAATWERMSFGGSGKRKARGVLTEMNSFVQQFASDFLAVNPKYIKTSRLPDKPAKIARKVT